MMDLLFRTLTSIFRRMLLGAAGVALSVLLAKGFIDVELRDDIVRWLSGDAASWLATIVMTLVGAAWTAADKYLARLKLEAARDLPPGATDAQINNYIRRYGGTFARLLTRG